MQAHSLEVHYSHHHYYPPTHQPTTPGQDAPSRDTDLAFTCWRKERSAWRVVKRLALIGCSLSGHVLSGAPFQEGLHQVDTLGLKEGLVLIGWSGCGVRGRGGKSQIHHPNPNFSFTLNMHLGMNSFLFGQWALTTLVIIICNICR